MAHFLMPLLRSAEPHGLQVERTGAWLAHRLEPAFDSRTRKKGLLGRDRLEDGTALVIAPCQAVHTFGMRFPIDIVAVARDGRVVKCRPAVGRRRVIVAVPAFAMVELPAGICMQSGVRPGDRLIVRPASNCR